VIKLADNSRKESTADIKEILKSHDAEKLSDIQPTMKSHKNIQLLSTYP
jgi:hypothetical protein